MRSISDQDHNRALFRFQHNMAAWTGAAVAGRRKGGGGQGDPWQQFMMPGSMMSPNMMAHQRMLMSQQMPGMMPHPGMALMPGGMAGNGDCYANIANRGGTVAGQEQHKPEDNLDQNWGEKSYLGGPKSHSLSLDQRAFLWHTALDGKVSRGTLQSWRGATYDASGFLLWKLDPAKVVLKALVSDITPRNILEQLNLTQQESYAEADIKAVKQAIVDNARRQDVLMDMALREGLEEEEEKPKKARVDFRGSESRGGYGFRGRSSEADGEEANSDRANSGNRQLQKRDSDLTLELKKMEQKLQLAKLTRQAAELEYETQKVKDAAKRAIESPGTNSTGSPSTESETSKKRRIAGADSSASPASVLSSPPDARVNAVAAALTERTRLLHCDEIKERATRVKALTAQLLLTKQAAAAAAAAQAHKDRTARVAAMVAELQKEKRKKRQATKATKERNDRIIARAKELREPNKGTEVEAASEAKANSAKPAATESEKDESAIAEEELEAILEAMTEEEEAAKLAEEAEAAELATIAATGAQQQAPAAMTEEEEAAKLAEEAEAAELTETAATALQQQVPSATPEEEEAAKLAEEAEAAKLAETAATGAQQHAPAAMTEEEEAAKLAEEAEAAELTETAATAAMTEEEEAAKLAEEAEAAELTEKDDENQEEEATLEFVGADDDL